jgi:predicted RNA-binding Zn-ribbon protein involved in translation (DUF1610 family)
LDLCPQPLDVFFKVGSLLVQPSDGLFWKEEEKELKSSSEIQISSCPSHLSGGLSRVSFQCPNSNKNHFVRVRQISPVLSSEEWKRLFDGQGQ